MRCIAEKCDEKGGGESKKSHGDAVFYLKKVFSITSTTRAGSHLRDVEQAD